MASIQKKNPVGMKLQDVQTPHLIIDRARFIANCGKMAEAVERLGWDFRAHIKTHKSPEASQVQCKETRTSRIIVSTIPEAWSIIEGDLVKDGTVTDILYSMPLPLDKLDRLREIKNYLERYGSHLRVMLDHPDQVRGLERYIKTHCADETPWSTFLKLDIGYSRAGLPPESAGMRDLMLTALSSPNISVFGTYTHAGFSYAAKNGQDAARILALEVSEANKAARLLQKLAQETQTEKKLPERGLIIAIGATPTAHASQEHWAKARKDAGLDVDNLVGKVELHAGNYCLLDLQQSATSLVSENDLAMSVGTKVVSVYPDRHEALCDAGGIAMSKDTGPIDGFGKVSSPASLRDWKLGRISQEHGILTSDSYKAPLPEIGDYLRILPQHACLTAAQHSSFLIVDGGDEIVDVWIPCKGW